MSADLEARVAELERQVADLHALVLGSPKRAFTQDVIRHKLRGALPDLMRHHPNGVTTKHVADHFGATVPTTIIALRMMVDGGKIQWVKRPGEQHKIVLPIGATTPPRATFTPRQQRTFDDLRALSANGRLEMSNHAIGLKLGVATGTVNYVLRCLVRDGAIKIVRRGTSFRPHVYHIPDRTTDADVWKAAHG